MPIPAVRIPPDSTGKRIAQIQFSEVEFNTGTIVFPLEDIVTGQTSGAFGTVVYIDGTTASGSIYVKMGHDSTSDFIVGENLRIGITTYAVCVSSTPYYSALVQVSGGNNPLQSAYIDQRGALYTRGPEGWHKFDALGRMQVSSMNWIGMYDFSNSKEDDLWGEAIVSGGSAYHHANTQSVVLSCNTTSGAKIQRTTHLYHHMLPNYAPNISMAISIGDNGKSGVTRRWGYYDDSDGVFFELSGTTLNVGMRSSRTGTPVDIIIPRTEWNNDRLDGSKGLFNLSYHQSELTNIHIFWFDFQSSGFIRWGTQSEEGEKITVHRRETSNAIFSTMATQTLPFRVEQFNTTTSASTSEMRVYHAMAGVEGDWKHSYKTFSAGITSAVSVTNALNPTFLSALRAAPTFENIVNRGFAYATSLSVYTRDQPIQLLYIKNPTLTGVSGWTQAVVGSALQKPTGSIAVSNTGTVLHSIVVSTGQSEFIDLTPIHNVQSDGEIRLLSNATANTQDVFAWIATSLPGTATAVTVVPSWNEYR